MAKEILLGDEAVALAALHAGISSSYAYPGTPSTEIFDYVRRLAPKFDLPVPQWSTNEKVAYEEAMGMSHAGKRTMVVMKHVGLNVAADPFMNSALTGAHGSLVVAVADDPSMHSSQNEQDTRYFAQFAQVPCVEPKDQQTAYDITREAFELSERFSIPVVLRLVTRLAHSRSSVEPSAIQEPKALNVATNDSDWTLLPVNARRRYKRLVDLQPELQKWSDESSFNTLTLNGAKGGLGIIATGIAVNYVNENLADMAEAPSVLHVQTYPYPTAKVRQLFEHCDKVLMVEDGYPVVERNIVGIDGVAGTEVVGRLTGDLPDTGELNPSLVRKAMGLAATERTGTVDAADLPKRPPALCPGCPHSDTYYALNEALEAFEGGKVYSDIGCYTLGAYPPYNAIQSCLCMGASVSMAKGAADAGVSPAIAVIGDSTFGHSGMTPLRSAVIANSPMTALILDNATVAMTGCQESAATDQDLLNIIEGLGVPKDHIRVINPLKKHHDENVKVLKEELAYDGISVIVPTRACVQIKPAKKS